MIVLVGILVAFLAYIALLFYQRGGLGRKNEPAVLWSWIPFIGHAYAFSKRPYEFMRENFAKHGNIFGFLLGSARTFAVGDAQSLLNVYKMKEMSFESHVDRTMVTCFGASKESNRFHDHGMTRRVNQKHMLRTDELNTLTLAFQAQIAKNMIPQLSHEWQDVNLFDFVLQHVLRGSLCSFFNDDLWHDEMMQDFIDFDQDFMLVACGAPKFMAPRAYRARQRLLNSMMRCCRGEEIYRCATVIWDRGQQLRKDGMQDQDIAAHNVALMWAMNANTIPSVFWALYDLLNEDGEGLRRVREELAQVTKEAAARQHVPVGLGVQYTLEDLNKMKLLEATMTESLRRTHHMHTLRTATEDCDVLLGNGRTVRLRKGDCVAILPFWIHNDPKLFPQPDKFIYDRFLRDADGNPSEFNKAGAETRLSMFPFGYGAHMCPGRLFAQNELKLMAAILLQHVEIELAPSSRNIATDPGRVMLSVLHPKGEVKARLRLRSYAHVAANIAAA